MTRIAQLVILMGIGLLTNSFILAVSAGFLFIIQITGWKVMLDILEKRALEAGLVFLLLAILAPLARDSGRLGDIMVCVSSGSGLLALAGGIMATHINAAGLDLLHRQPRLGLGIILGSLLGIILWHGVPVGPLMAAGITALLLELLGRRQGP
ncbi:MAG: DUF441 family protein [Bacillota bacterium]|uniref:DUF441 family protein n=1 Tax=Desulfurispora thermophila TaxID=265470 RepID=UPI000A01FBD2|nr:DUF441 family protein [Desulfurispora thermophila]